MVCLVFKEYDFPELLRQSIFVHSTIRSLPAVCPESSDLENNSSFFGLELNCTCCYSADHDALKALIFFVRIVRHLDSERKTVEKHIHVYTHV